MTNIDICSTCQSKYDEKRSGMTPEISYPVKSKFSKKSDLLELDCLVCGKYQMSLKFYESSYIPRLDEMTNVQRAALSHFIISSNQNDIIPEFNAENISSMVNNARLPSPSTQVINLIRFIGNEQNVSGIPIIDLPNNFFAIIGSPNITTALDLISQMSRKDLVSYNRSYLIRESTVDDINLGLTLEGWERFESVQVGKIASDYGFVAFQFDNLDFLRVLEYVKPKIQKLGFDLKDLRNETTVGTVDNIMRLRIRDAAFIIADLTDDNRGAYWESGFAEGVGKPVIFVCEEKKFEEWKTHFDTNHQMTIMWSVGEMAKFGERLEATIREAVKE